MVTPSMHNENHLFQNEEAHLRTLWIGDLEGYMDENFVYSLFAHTNEVAQIKVIRDKGTGLGSGYGFVEFNNTEIAKYVLETHNGKPLPIGNGKMYRLNWAAHGINERKAEIFTEYSVFVGDLSPEVTDYLLLQTFADKYQSVRSAKVVIDVNTGLSKRYGFVRFGNEDEMNRALLEMQGQYCGSRPIRLNHAIPRKQESSSPPSPPRCTSPPLNEGKLPIQIPDGDPFNTTVFIGGLDPSVTEDDLRFHFSPYGELVYIKIPVGKACGFVQFTNRISAESAFEKHGSIIGRQRVRLSWGRSSKGTPSTPYPSGGNEYINGGQSQIPHTITASPLSLSSLNSSSNSTLSLSAQLSQLSLSSPASSLSSSLSLFQNQSHIDDDNEIFNLNHFANDFSPSYSRLNHYLSSQDDTINHYPNNINTNLINDTNTTTHNNNNDSNFGVRRDQLFLSSLSENTLTLACNMGLPFSFLSPTSQSKNVR